MKQLIRKFAIPLAPITIVCLLVLAAHWPGLPAGALSFDDQQYLTENLLVQNPGWTSARRFLTEVLQPSTVQGYYQPLSMISLMFDYALGGREDYLRPFHQTSLIIHIANTALIIILLYQLFGNIWIASVAGLLFGVHPMTVEPVFWVGERKTILAAFFAFLCLNFYLRYCQTNKKYLYIICLLMFLLALMSKPTSIPLPIMMLLMDYWPLKRFNKKTFLEKLPLFVLAGIFAVITFVSQNRTAGTQIPGQTDYSLQHVPLIICNNIIFYLHKIIWPLNLSSYYPLPKPLALSNPFILSSLVGTCALILLLIVSFRRTPAILTAFLIFFVTILPTMGVIRFTDTIAYDKFVYLPSIGLLIMLAWLLIRLGEHFKSAILQASLLIFILILAGTCTALTRHYLRYWQDTITFCNYMLELNPDAATVHNNLANALQTQNRFSEALDHYHQAIQSNPLYVDAYNNLGVVYGKLGRFDEAIKAFKQVIKLNPLFVEGYCNLGVALRAIDRNTDAIQAYKEALRINPYCVQAHFNLVLAYRAIGDKASAFDHYKILKQLHPYLANQLLDYMNE